MLQAVDRILVAVRDADVAERRWQNLLGAEREREDALEYLRCHRLGLRVGRSVVDLLVPTGPGPVSDFLGAWDEGLFAAGFSVRSLSALRQRLSDEGVRWTEEANAIFLDAAETGGMSTVLQEHAPREPRAGDTIAELTQVTHLVRSWKQARERHLRVFGLDPSHSREIASARYGYAGSLLILGPEERPHSIELAEITDPGQAMGRFFRRRGESLYMAYLESDRMDALVARLETHGARFAVGAGRREDPDQLFIHPSSLGGVLLGVGRIPGVGYGAGPRR